MQNFKLQLRVLQALYNPGDLSNGHHLECWTCELTLVMHRQHSIVTMNLVTRYFSAHITTVEYVVHYITQSLSQKVI